MSIENNHSTQTGKVAMSPGLHKIPTVASGALLQGGNSLVIEHGESRYRLQLTRSQKLLLTKE